MGQYRELRRDGCCAQFAVHVKNAEALLDVVHATVAMAHTLEAQPPACLPHRLDALLLWLAILWLCIGSKP